MTAWTARRGRVMALDLGSRRIGVAFSDRARTMALPWGTVERGADPEADRKRVVQVAVEEEATTVVVGLPLSLDGRPGPAARRAIEEAARLAEALAAHQVSVETFDERLTTVSAASALAQGGIRRRAQRTMIDQAAATVLLQAWLDARSAPDTP